MALDQPPTHLPASQPLPVLPGYPAFMDRRRPGSLDLLDAAQHPARVKLFRLVGERLEDSNRNALRAALMFLAPLLAGRRVDTASPFARSIGATELIVSGSLKPRGDSAVVSARVIAVFAEAPPGFRVVGRSAITTISIGSTSAAQDGARTAMSRLIESALHGHARPGCVIQPARLVADPEMGEYDSCLDLLCQAGEAWAVKQALSIAGLELSFEGNPTAFTSWGHLACADVVRAARLMPVHRLRKILESSQVRRQFAAGELPGRLAAIRLISEIARAAFSAHVDGRRTDRAAAATAASAVSAYLTAELSFQHQEGAALAPLVPQDLDAAPRPDLKRIAHGEAVA